MVMVCEEQLALLAQELGALDAGRDVGGQGVGQVQVVLGERLLHRAAVEVQDAQAFARRAQQHAQDRGHGALGDAAGAGQFGIFARRWQHRIDSPRVKERWARFWLKPGRLAILAVAAGQGAQLQRAVRPLGQDDGAALGVERADGVVEDRVQQLFFAFQVDEVMAGPQQGQQLLARPRAAVAVEGQALRGRLPR